MLRFILLIVLVILVARAFWQVLDGVFAGAGGPRRGSGPLPGVPMVRDPVCGTFVVPDRAVSIGEGQRRVHFCSAACRDAYRSQRARPA